MSVKNFLFQRLTYFNRLNTKNRVINSIINNEQFNNGVINVHGIDERNV